MGRSIIVGLAVLALAAIAAAPALADDTFDFESPSLPAGTQVSNQYAGITFLSRSSPVTYLPEVEVVAPGAAHSGTHVLQEAPTSVEFAPPAAEWTFATTRSTVSLWVRNVSSPTTLTSRLQLQAYDAAGDRVDANGGAYTSVAASSSGWTQLTATAAGDNIARARLQPDPADSSEQGQRIWFDDLSASTPTSSSTPDFTLNPPTPASVDEGQSVSRTFTVSRLNGSSGAIHYTVSGLPAGVTASFPGGDTTSSDSVTVTLSAGIDVAPGSYTATIIGSPAGPAAGTGSRPTSFPVSVNEVRPAVTITSPAPGTLLDRAPDVVAVAGTATGPRPLSTACAVLTATPTPVPPAPASCGARVNPGDGSWFTNVTGARAGTNWITAFVRDGSGHIGVAQASFQVVSPATGVDLQANGMELTQAIQPLSLPNQISRGGRVQRYGGVQLVADRTTWVRFYANAAHAARPGVPLHGVFARLHVFRNGVEIPGSPFLPDGGPRDLASGASSIFPSTRGDLNSSYNFTLPANLVHGSLSFRADLNPAPGAIAECATCLGNNSFEVTGVTFRPMQTQFVLPLAMTYTTGGTRHSPADFDPGQPAFHQIPSDIFSLISRIYPQPITVEPYQGVIDASSVMNDPHHAADTDDNNNWKNQAGNDLVSNWERDNGIDGVNFVVGISPASAGNALRGVTTWYYRFPFSGFTDSIGIESRPLTGVGHEMGHYEGLSHAAADPVCYSDGHGGVSQPGVDWPPDQHGYIQGIGVGAAGGSPLTASSLVVPGASDQGIAPAYAGQYFDFMSYCTFANENATWISTINWNNLVSAHNAGPVPSPAADVHASPAAAGTLTVDAIVGQGGQTHITSVTPGLSPPTKPAAGSPFHVILRDHAGRVVSDTALASHTGHVDAARGVPATGFLSVSGTVPAPGLSGSAGDGASVTLAQGATPLAERIAPASSPRVRIITPRRRQHLRGHLVTVRWAVQATGPTVSSIDYSPNGGRTWHTVEVGTSATSFSLPARMFSRSSRARVRVRTSDGFHEAVAVSAPFTADGSPPVVRIISLRSGLRVRADVALALSGQGFADSGALLAGRRLTWLVGRRVLGHGRELAVSGLAPGKHTLTLQGRDAFGRIGRASITLSVVAVAPQVLTLRAPSKLSPHARRLTIRIAASIDSLLRVGGGTTSPTSLGRRLRTVSVGIRPGRTRLRLQLRVRAYGRQATVPLTIAR